LVEGQNRSFGTKLDLDLDLGFEFGVLVGNPLVGQAQSEGKNRIVSPEAKMMGASHDFSLSVRNVTRAMESEDG